MTPNTFVDDKSYTTVIDTWRLLQKYQTVGISWIFGRCVRKLIKEKKNGFRSTEKGTHSLLLASRLRRRNSSTVTPFELSQSCFSCSNARFRSSNSRICISRACRMPETHVWINPFDTFRRLSLDVFCHSPFCAHRVVASIPTRNPSIFASFLSPSFRRLVPFRPPFSSFFDRAHVSPLPFEPVDSCKMWIEIRLALRVMCATRMAYVRIRFMRWTNKFLI